jgi:Lhr-like helicase
MAQSTPLYVGLDVHKDSIAVAHAQGQSAAPPVFVGTIGPRQADLDQLIRRLETKGRSRWSRTKPVPVATSCIAI